MFRKVQSKAIQAGLSGITVAILFGEVVDGRQDMKCSDLAVDATVSIIGEPKIGEPFDVIFRFIPSDSFIHTLGVLDSVYLVCHSGVQYLDGDTLWEGSLEMQCEYELRARYVVHSPIRFGFFGVVQAAQVLGKIVPSMHGPHAGRDMGVKGRSVTNSRIVDLRPEDERRPVETLPVLLATDSGVVLADSTVVPVPSRFSRVVIVGPQLDTTDLGPRPVPKPSHLPHSPIYRRVTLPIKIAAASPDTVRIRYDPGREYAFITDSLVTEVQVTLVRGNASYRKVTPKVGTFELSSDTAVFIVTASDVTRTLVLSKSH
ncbi:MAG TPA: hypothetical protein VN285_02675 [Candidatus Deferrimicrobium sp.]|nr:hypothetical protein [Candidatus Deferrimicrobium sp.]